MLGSLKMVPDGLLFLNVHDLVSSVPLSMGRTSWLLCSDYSTIEQMESHFWYLVVNRPSLLSWVFFLICWHTVYLFLYWNPTLSEEVQVTLRVLCRRKTLGDGRQRGRISGHPAEKQHHCLPCEGAIMGGTQYPSQVCGWHAPVGSVTATSQEALCHPVCALCSAALGN